MPLRLIPDSLYDAAIIGAGPAGSGAAIALARAGKRVHAWIIDFHDRCTAWAARGPDGGLQKPQVIRVTGRVLSREDRAETVIALWYALTGKA